MSEDELERELLSKVDVDRRSFIKRAIGSAFAVPIVASFSMDALSSDAVAARTPNGVKRQHRSRGAYYRTSYYTRNNRHHGSYDSHVQY